LGVVRVVLLAAGVLGVLLRPRRTPVWAVPAVMVAVGLAVGAYDVAAIGDSVDPMVEPLAFLLLAVPLAVMLDHLGFFAAVAARIDHGRRLHLGLWCLAAAVTTLFNLDASVVLLTPLYVRIARRHGLDPLALAFVPMLLACFASSALPVSNLTNLLAAGRFDVSTADFAVRLGPASAVAVALGYRLYRRVFPEGDPAPTSDEPVDPRALKLGGPVVAFVMVGFTLGEVRGIAPWMVAAAADVVLVAMLRALPWRTVPAGAAALAAALGVLAATASPHLGLGGLLAGSGSLATVKIFAVSVIGANAVNNLPAILVCLPALGSDPGIRLWPALLGVNIGPVLVVSGSLAGLLWLDTTRRLGVPVTAGRFSRVGCRVGLPVLAAACLTMLLTNLVAP
jgi:arsenical pump membrane protein